MFKVIETSLVLRRETKFDKMRRMILRMFFKEEYFINQSFNELMKIRKIDTSKIIIPKEIGVRNERNNFL